MKILLCVVILCGSSYIGFGLTKGYRRRVRLYDDLLLFCGNVKSQISYFQLKLYDVIEKSKQNGGKDFLYICNTAQTSLKHNDFPIIKNKDLHQLFFLAENEAAVICEFFSVLGSSDCKNQTEQISGFEKIFDGLSASAKADSKTKGNLYGKLGVFLGLFVAILCL